MCSHLKGLGSDHAAEAVPEACQPFGQCDRVTAHEEHASDSRRALQLVRIADGVLQMSGSQLMHADVQSVRCGGCQCW